MYDYLDKYRGTDGRNSVLDILRLDNTVEADWIKIKQNYVASAFKADGTVEIPITKVKIGGNIFTQYGQFQFLYEKSYVKSPERSADGTISNLNSHAFFITPHLLMNFSVMSIDDYREIIKMDLEQNEFVVECYDPIYNSKFKGKMYFATPEMAKLLTIAKKRFNQYEWEEYVELYGVQDYTVELIGTNADLDLVSVVYHLNPPAETGQEDYPVGEPNDIYSGEEVVIGASATEITNQTFGGIYKFSKWNTSPSGGDTGNYLNGYAYTINAPLVLYAQWESVTEHTLTFNYGLSDPIYNESSFTYETSRKVVKGQPIGSLPVAELPKVKYKDINGVEHETTDVYSNGRWYKTPIKAPNSIPLTETEPYWIDRDSTIYLLYDTAQYYLSLYIWNGTDFEQYQGNLVQYNSPMNLPMPVRSGYKFDGWYISSDMTGTKASGNMPPYPLALYGKWIEEK